MFICIFTVTYHHNHKCDTLSASPMSTYYQGDKHTFASVPLSSRSAKSWAQSLAAGIFVSSASTSSCGHQSHRPHTAMPSSSSSSMEAEAPDAKLHPFYRPLSALQKEKPSLDTVASHWKSPPALRAHSYVLDAEQIDPG